MAVVYMTEEHGKALDIVLSDELLSGIQGNFLKACAELTVRGHGRNTADEIAQLVWRASKQPRMDARVRTTVSSLRATLDRYYSTRGKDDSFRFSIEPRTYRITVQRQLDFPHPDVEIKSSDLVQPQAFGAFLRTMCGSSSLTTHEINLQVRLWHQGAGLPLKLRQDSEFDDLLNILSNWLPSRPLSLTEMRNLCRRLRISPILLDSLIASDFDGDCMTLRLSNFMVSASDEESHGREARYAFQPSRYPHSGAHSILLQLAPGGRSDAHYHSGDEIVVPLSGNIEVRLHESGLRTAVAQGEAMHFRAGQVHSLVNLSRAQPAFIFVVRIYSPPWCESRPVGRELMRKEIGAAFEEGRPLESWAKGWILDALVRKPSPDGLGTRIRDQRGLARLVRLLGKPTQRAEQEFLSSVSIWLRKQPSSSPQTFEEFLDQMETKDLTLPAAFLDDIRDLYGDVYYPLLLHFLSPAVSDAVVFRPNDHLDVAPLQTTTFAPDGVEHTLCARNLSCSDVFISRLLIQPGRGTEIYRHPGYELLVPLAGDANIQFEASGASGRISSDQRLFVQCVSSSFHRVSNPTESVAELLVIRLAGEGGAPWLRSNRELSGESSEIDSAGDQRGRQ
jgi:quercetin dioxygenase-like cupin family protein